MFVMRTSSWLSRPRSRGAALCVFALVVGGIIVGGMGMTPRLRAASQDAISEAIDKGIEYLLGKVEENQLARKDQWSTGQVALETYALVVAGVSVDHPLIQKNFETLRQKAFKPAKTYTVSCYAFALDAAISQIHQDMQFLGGKLIPDGPRIGDIWAA